MKIFLAVIAVQAFLLMTEAKSIPTEKSKRVVCYYMPSERLMNGTLKVEDIDTSICTHLVLDETTVHLISEEYYLRKYNISEEGNSNRQLQTIEEYQQLKENNPDLKLIAQIRYWSLSWIHHAWGAEESKNISLDAVRFVKELGFDGLEILIDLSNSQKKDTATDLICDLKTQFEKHGFEITNVLKGKSSEISNEQEEEDDYSVLAGCVDHFALLTINQEFNFTKRLTSLTAMEEDVEKYIKRGIPADKILITITGFGNLFTLADSANNGMGAEIDRQRSPTINHDTLRGLIFLKNLTIELNNSSLGWTIRRDEETKEPYAFSKTGLWASYEDRISVEAKAKYALENGLGGIAVIPIDTEDIEGIGGEGRFPLTRAAFNALHKGLQSVDNNS